MIRMMRGVRLADKVSTDVLRDRWAISMPAIFIQDH